MTPNRAALTSSIDEDHGAADDRQRLAIVAELPEGAHP